MKRFAMMAAAAAVLGAAPAFAKDIPAGGLTIEEVQSWLQDAGYKAEMKTAKNGDRYLSSAAEGTNFTLDMYDCKDGRCASAQFEASFDLSNGTTASKMNEWNTSKRYMRAVIDDEGDPALRYDINLSPGGTYEALKDDFGVFRGFLSDFKKFINF